MKASEYEAFFADPTGFLIRKVLPRHDTLFKGFTGFPNLINLASGYGSMLVGFPLYLMQPAAKEMFEKLIQIPSGFVLNILL